MAGRWMALLGPQGRSRSNAVWTLVEQLRRGGVVTGGFVHERRENRVEMVDVGSGARLTLATLPFSLEEAEWQVDEAAVARKRRDLAASRADVVFIHAGSLEGHGQGHWQSTLDAMEREALVVLCTPADVLARMRRSLPSPLDALSLPCSPQALTAFGVELILRAPNMRYHAVPSWGSGTPKGDDSP